MRQRTKIALGIFLALGLFIITLWWLSVQSAADLKPPLTVTFQGYTNLPGFGSQRFARLAISNQSNVKFHFIRNTTCVEGTARPKIDLLFLIPSGGLLQRYLEPGESKIYAVGEPSNATNGTRWQEIFVLDTCTWRKRLRNFAITHKLPIQFGPFSIPLNEPIFIAEGPWLQVETNAPPLLSFPATNSPPPATNLLPQNASTNPAFPAIK